MLNILPFRTSRLFGRLSCSSSFFGSSSTTAWFHQHHPSFLLCTRKTFFSHQPHHSYATVVVSKRPNRKNNDELNDDELNDDILSQLPSSVQPSLSEHDSFVLTLPVTSTRQKIFKELGHLPPVLNQVEKEKRACSERVSKYLSRMGVCSKQQGVELIKEGVVKVNGEVVTETGCKINPFFDSVTVRGEKINNDKVLSHVKIYAYHKPREVLCSRVDNQGNRETLYQRLERLGFGHLISVGRLDYNSEGLLLLTNDGQLARHLELPQTGLQRHYLIKIHGKVTQSMLDSLRKGSSIEGVHYAGMDATIHREGEKSSWIKVVLHEGKNREIRKIFQHLHYPVSRIIRIQYGPYKLENIQKGQLKALELHNDMKKYCSSISRLSEKIIKDRIDEDQKEQRRHSN